LSKGEGEHDYKLTTENGATWELRSNNVALSRHSGQTVTVTGRVQNELHGAKGKNKDERDKDATEHGHLKVTKVSVVSGSCKK